MFIRGIAHLMIVLVKHCRWSAKAHIAPQTQHCCANSSECQLQSCQGSWLNSCKLRLAALHDFKHFSTHLPFKIMENILWLVTNSFLLLGPLRNLLITWSSAPYEAQYVGGCMQHFSGAHSMHQVRASCTLIQHMYCLDLAAFSAVNMK